MCLRQVWYTILSQGCTEAIKGELRPGVPEKGRQPQPDEAAVMRRLVADVGANFGYYSLYAAAHGCRYGLRSRTWVLGLRDVGCAAGLMGEPGSMSL